jgi:DNA-binding NarL/FixJ family response regulator
MTIRVLVVDDYPVFRAGLVAILEDLKDVEVVAQACDGEQAIDEVASHRPDVVLMDLRMPGIGGLGATARITAHHPNTAVIVLTMDSDHNSVFAALRAGARGYLLKEADGDDVQRALHAVSKGEAVFGPRIAERVISFFATPRVTSAPDPFPQLTPREREILQLIAQGLDNAGIARRLVLTEKSVRNRVSDILTKLRARSRAEAVALARNAGLGGEQTSPTTIHSGREADHS